MVGEIEEAGHELAANCDDRDDAAVLLTISGSAAAQTAGGTGVISGTVTDNTKAMLPGVTVTVSGSAAMGTPSAVTGENGTFRIPSLPPGEYSVRFELTGFGTVIREGIRVGVGFTATVNVDLNVAGVSESVTVSGQSPVVDVTNTTVATRYDTELLASLPGARDYWAVLAQTPAVSMGRVDVGGSGALTQQPYTAYGLTSAGGVNRAEVEGIMVNEGAGGGGSDMYYTDYGAFAEIAINAVGNGAEMPNPGVLSQLIAKSGGNQYHGNVYFDYQNESMEATNIDDAQIAAGVIGSDVVDPRDTNRLEMFRDFNADLGGFVRRDRLWWYGAIRRTDTGQRYPTLLDDIQDTWVPVGTGKATWNVAQNHKLSGFYQYQTKEQPDYLGAIRIAGGRQSPALMTQDTVWHSTFPLHVWKAEYSAVLGSALFFEARAGAYHSVWAREGKSTAPRIEDIGNNFVAGGVWSTDLRRHRPQGNASLAYAKQGWGGNHNFKLGAEVMRDLLVQPFAGFPGASQALSVRNNNVATQVDIYLPGSESKNGLWTYSLFLNDSWQAGRRLTVNAGLRFDRHSAYLPDQVGPAGQTLQPRRRHRHLQQLGAAAQRQLRPDRRRQDPGQGELGPLLALSRRRPRLRPQPERDDVVRALRVDRRQRQRRLRPGRTGRVAARAGRAGGDDLRREPREHLRRSVHRLPRARGDEQLRGADRVRVERPAPGARPDQRQPPARRLRRAGDLPRPGPRRARRPPATTATC